MRAGVTFLLLVAEMLSYLLPCWHRQLLWFQPKTGTVYNLHTPSEPGGFFLFRKGPSFPDPYLITFWIWSRIQNKDPEPGSLLKTVIFYTI